MDRTSPLPLWAQLLEDLKARIAAGEFAQRFPTDKEMIERYQVSRQTVREAVRRLEADGIVVRHRGRGTVLTEDRFVQQLGALYSLFREIENSGHHQSSKVIAQEVIVERSKALDFGIGPDEELFYLERVRFADDIEVALDKVYIPMRFAGPIVSGNFEHTGLYDELESRAQIAPTRGQERIAPVLLDEYSMKMLGCSKPCAAMLIQRTTFYGNDMLEYRETLLRGDRYCFVSSFDSTKNELASNLAARQVAR